MKWFIWEALRNGHFEGEQRRRQERRARCSVRDLQEIGETVKTFPYDLREILWTVQ